MALNTNFTAGQVLTAAQQNNFPRGVAGSVRSTAGNTVLGATYADVTGATVTFTAAASRIYKVSFSAIGGKATNAGQILWKLTDGTTDYGEFFQDIPAGSFAALNSTWTVSGLTAGSKTLKVQAYRSTAAATIYASGGNILQFVIEDIGAP